MKFADLHVHTEFSDGTYSPGELINRAADLDMGAIAVTDHDTIDGVLLTIEAGKKKNIEVIPAVELTAEFNGREVHILGYFIELGNQALVEKLNFLKNNRIQRIYKMVEQLKKINVVVDPEDVFKISGCGTVGRLHLARVLVKSGYVNSIYQAFNKYIGEQSPAYVCGFRLNPQEAINLIKNSRGIAVLAHPYIVRNDDLISLFVDYGIRGLEVYYPEHTSAMTERYRNLADKYGLFPTGGSDCHGDAKSDACLGSVKIPLQLVENLRQAKEKN